MTSRQSDIDPLETREWIESIESVLRAHGPDRARFLVDQVMDHMRRAGADMPYGATTAYLNTIPTDREPAYPGNDAIEKRIAAYIRWNAMAMVLQANRESSEYGGHIATYASAATLYEVGFNHFWRGAEGDHRGDMIFIQGHSSPGIYARAYLEGRLDELLLACRQLREENRSLKQRQDSLIAERASLLQKNEQVRSRVEAMITRLKAMEHGA